MGLPTNSQHVGLKPKDIDHATVRRVQHRPHSSLENRARPTSGKEKGFCDHARRQETLLVSLNRSMVEQRENLSLIGKLFF